MDRLVDCFSNTGLPILILKSSLTKVIFSKKMQDSFFQSK